MSKKSAKIGSAFEEAALVVMPALFKAWGYTVHDPRIQRAGNLQHGCDIVFNILKGTNSLPIRVLIECKASFELKSISLQEMEEKITDAEHIASPKDIHICLSPTKAISRGNHDTHSLGQNAPFCVVDFMRKNEGVNHVLNLFVQYAADTNRNQDDRAIVSAYLQHIKEITNDPANLPQNADFAQSAQELSNQFESTVLHYSANSSQTAYQILTPLFWNNRKSNQYHTDDIWKYYTSLYSAPDRLMEIVALDYHASNQDNIKKLDEILKQDMNCKSILIKILDTGGTGKSTFLLDFAKNKCLDYCMFWVSETKQETFDAIEKDLSLLTLPSVVLIDNASNPEMYNFLDRLVNFSRSKLRQIIVVIAERPTRYKQLSNIREIDQTFSFCKDFDISSPSNEQKSFQEEIFNKFFDALLQSPVKADSAKLHYIQENKNRYHKLYQNVKTSVKKKLEPQKVTIADRIYSVLSDLKEDDQISFKFDWDEWKEQCDKQKNNLKDLYLIVAAFYQYGLIINIDFCLSLNILDSSINKFKIIDTIGSTKTKNPIILNDEKLYLRHEMIAKWCIQSETNEYGEEKIAFIYNQWLDNVGAQSPIGKDILLSLYRNLSLEQSKKLFKCKSQNEIDYCFFKKLSFYIEEINPNTKTARNEAARILRKLAERVGNDKKQSYLERAKKLLLEIREKYPEDTYALIELSKVYQQLNKWEDAESILEEAINNKKEKNQFYAYLELSRVYRSQEKWDKAHKCLDKYIEINSDTPHPRTELGLLYIAQKKWAEAEKVFLENIDHNENHAHSYNQLGKLYWKELGDKDEKYYARAEEFLLANLAIEPRSEHAYTQLGQLYKKQKKFTKAEKILQKSLDKGNKTHYTYTTLSDIYKEQGKYKKVIDELGAQLAELGGNCLLELATVYRLSAQEKSRSSDEKLSALNSAEGCLLQLLQSPLLKVETDKPKVVVELSIVYREMQELLNQKSTNKDTSKLNAAQKYLEKVIEQSPNSDNLGIYIQLGEVGKALFAIDENQDTLADIADKVWKKIPNKKGKTDYPAEKKYEKYYPVLLDLSECIVLKKYYHEQRRIQEAIDAIAAENTNDNDQAKIFDNIIQVNIRDTDEFRSLEKRVASIIQRKLQDPYIIELRKYLE